MSEPIISVENLGKKYIIDHQVVKQPYKSLRETITNKSKGLARKLVSATRNDPADFAPHTKEDFWALKDVSFEVKQGEVLGIIGRNGAGKSTLLKVLSRITEPTKGRVRIRGRVASLLEVGTGFHPELTGRENVFLNGSILGMGKAEIRRKFDEIVAFAGVEKFLDTPVKRYSSGMYVRLAFAVAAHLEPEILVVDEVLAVGDAEFQKKCLGKMKEVSQGEGRTVLFVSHNLQAVTNLTTAAVFLDKGTLLASGATGEIISTYLNHGANQSLDYVDDKPLGNAPKITRVALQTSESGNMQVHGDPLDFYVDVSCPHKVSAGGNVSIQIFNSAEVPVVHFWTINPVPDFLGTSGVLRLKCTLPHCRLFMGRYTVTVYLGDASALLIHKVENVCPFEVTMFKSPRDLVWQEGSSTFLDEFSWQVLE